VPRGAAQGGTGELCPVPASRCEAHAVAEKHGQLELSLYRGNVEMDVTGLPQVGSGLVMCSLIRFLWCL